jgi:hypothetical protein
MRYVVSGFQLTCPSSEEQDIVGSGGAKDPFDP